MTDAKDTNRPGAIKLDAGKPTFVKGGLTYFADAIAGVAAVSRFGANKYAWDGWRYVDDGIDRYTEAMVRHLVLEGKGEVLDPESRLPHSWHTAWNALARAELKIIEAVENGRNQ
jgi:Domain of unknown function (DUF5664)